MRRRRPRVRTVLLAVAALAALVLGSLIVRDVLDWMKKPPSFSSLSGSPDPSLRGTVAYFDGFDNGCVRVIAAAGAPAKDVLCFPDDVDVEVDGGVGPELTWLADGRLQVTIYEWSGVSDDINQITGAWSKIIDVATGDASDVSADQVPRRPTPATDPSPAANGDSVECTSGGGRIEITQRTSGSSRVLLSAKGNPDYRLAGPCIWSPDGQWILAQEADEGRLLLVTTTDPAETRVLAQRPGCVGSCGSTGIDLRLVAVTTQDVLGDQP